MKRTPDPRRHLLPFALPLAVGAALRLFGLTRQSLWVDELLTIRGAALDAPLTWADVWNPQGPLPGILLRAWVVPFGTGDLSLRAWAAVAGILGLVLAAVTFRRIVPSAALLALWFLALSPFHIWYSQEVRNYVFLLNAVLFVLWSLDRARERGGRGDWILHGVGLVALLLSNFSGGFLLPALGLGIFIWWRSLLRPWLATVLAALVAVSPWLWVEVTKHLEWGALPGAEAATPVRESLGVHLGAIPFTYATFLGGYGLGPSLRGMHEGVPFALFLPVLPGLLVAAVCAGAALVLAARERSTPWIGSLWVQAVLPVLVAMAVAYLGLKAFNPRYAAVAFPAFLLLLAIGAHRALRDRRAAGICLVAGLVGVSVLGWARQSFDPRYAREDYRGAGAYLSRVAEPGDLILEQGVHGLVDRYYEGPARIVPFYSVYREAPDGGAGRLDAMLSGSRRVWWVGSRLWFEDPEGHLASDLAARGREAGTWEGNGVRVTGTALGSSP